MAPSLIDTNDKPRQQQQQKTSDPANIAVDVDDDEGGGGDDHSTTVVITGLDYGNNNVTALDADDDPVAAAAAAAAAAAEEEGMTAKELSSEDNNLNSTTSTNTTQAKAAVVWHRGKASATQSARGNGNIADGNDAKEEDGAATAHDPAAVSVAGVEKLSDNEAGAVLRRYLQKMTTKEHINSSVEEDFNTKKSKTHTQTVKEIDAGEKTDKVGESDTKKSKAFLRLVDEVYSERTDKFEESLMRLANKRKKEQIQEYLQKLTTHYLQIISAEKDFDKKKSKTHMQPAKEVYSERTDKFEVSLMRLANKRKKEQIQEYLQKMNTKEHINSSVEEDFNTKKSKTHTQPVKGLQQQQQFSMQFNPQMINPQQMMHGQMMYWGQPIVPVHNPQMMINPQQMMYWGQPIVPMQWMMPVQVANDGNKKSPEEPTKTESKSTSPSPTEGADGEKGGACMKQVVKAKAKAKTCSHEGCTNYVQKGGVCIRHGAKVKTCSHEGCSNNSLKGGVCTRHGAKVKSKTLCSHEGCTNQVQRRGVCIRHGAKVVCRHEGCTSNVQNREVCMRHGAKVKTCSHEGCTNYVQKGGLCKRHGAARTKPTATEDAPTNLGEEEYVFDME